MTKYHPTWAEYTERYNEKPEDFYDDPAIFWEKSGDKDRANAIRARRRKIRDGEIEDE